MADQSSGPFGLPPTVWVVIVVGLAGALAATQHRGVESVISFMNLLAIRFLIFWVADALFLTRCFALALAKDPPHPREDVFEDVFKEKAQELGVIGAAVMLRRVAESWRSDRG